MPSLFQNCLDSIVNKNECQEALDDLIGYADMLENLSDIQETEDRLRRNVDELNYEDCGFLRSYSDFSFCTTAQVQNGNVNQMQATKVICQNGGVTPVSSHEMHEPIISKVLAAQTSTAEGL